MIAIYDEEGVITGILEGSLATPPETANWIEVPDDFKSLGARALINGFMIEDNSFVPKSV